MCIWKWEGPSRTCEDLGCFIRRWSDGLEGVDWERVKKFVGEEEGGLARIYVHQSTQDLFLGWHAEPTVWYKSNIFTPYYRHP